MDRIRIIEVGPRDGLQNEAAQVPTTVKVAFVDALAAAILLQHFLETRRHAAPPS